MKSLSFVVAVTSTLLFSAPLAVFAHAAHGAGKKESAHDWKPKPRPPVTAPSNNYSGGTPINHDNGGFFNNGTFGAPNPDYELWATSPTWAVSLAERPYSFEQKARFITSLDERIHHFEMAVWNYGQVTEVSKPEGLAHAKQAAADLTPRIEKARDAWEKAKSSGRDEWDKAQVEAKRAFLELQSFSYGLHKNVVAQ